MADERLLFLSAHLPVLNAREAGQKTAFRNLRWLRERYSITLIAFCNELERTDDISGLKELCEKVALVPVTRHSRLRGVASKPQLPLLVAARWSAQAVRLIREALQTSTFDRVHCEWAQMAVYVPLFASVPCKTLNLHDVLWQWCARRGKRSGPLSRALWHVEAARTLKWESAVYAMFSCIYVPTSKDRDLLLRANCALHGKVSVLAHLFERYRPHREEVRSSARNVLFWGALSRKENLEGVAWLIGEVLPHVQRRLPDVKIFVVGSNPPQWLREQRCGAVQVTGFVPDPTPYFERADVAVLPLFCGAGVKVKVLECLAAGLPVLTTGIGAEGIPAEPKDGLIVLEPDAEAFAAKIVELLSSPERLRELGRAAARWVETNTAEDKEVILSPQS